MTTPSHLPALALVAVLFAVTSAMAQQPAPKKPPSPAPAPGVSSPAISAPVTSAPLAPATKTPDAGAPAAAAPVAPMPAPQPTTAGAPTAEKPEPKASVAHEPPPGPVGGTQPAPAAAESPDVNPDMQRVAACKTEALKRLKQNSASIDDIYLDVDGLTIAQADLKIGDTPVKGVIMGEAYIQRDRSDTANRFLCLTGVNDEVLFTFFTER
ncbi:hypothetical protein [Ancylobacter pratisalsi]|uniref:hypothetical protein n=1 Tax=Ancylobacter pratisalsi TaxID=1745854 RepID=UPI001FE459CF|nr:hypothetical protein [Ancylobacter pratisalsi]